MPVDRAQWAQKFRRLPRWACPTCQRGHLRTRREGFLQEETGPSRKNRDDPAWDPTWTLGCFTTIMRCDDPNCGDLVIIAGDLTYTEGILDEEGQDYEEEYRVTLVAPGLKPFKIAAEVPDDIAEHITSAGGLFWSDAEAAANKLRQAVEAFLTNRGVRRSTIDRHRKRRFLTLHARIEEYAAKNKDVADHLLAMKFIGNAVATSGAWTGGRPRWVRHPRTGPR